MYHNWCAEYGIFDTCKTGFPRDSHIWNTSEALKGVHLELEFACSRDVTYINILRIIYCFKALYWHKVNHNNISHIMIYMYQHESHIKTNGSESRGQERAKQITKNKMRDKLLCVFYTSKHFHNMTS